jgi:hypothetical protein
MPPAPGLAPDRALGRGGIFIGGLQHACGAIRQAAPDRLAQVTLGTISPKRGAHENLMCEPISVGKQDSGGEANALALRASVAFTASDLCLWIAPIYSLGWWTKGMDYWHSATA